MVYCTPTGITRRFRKTNFTRQNQVIDLSGSLTFFQVSPSKLLCSNCLMYIVKIPHRHFLVGIYSTSTQLCIILCYFLLGCKVGRDMSGWKPPALPTLVASCMSKLSSDWLLDKLRTLFSCSQNPVGTLQ